MRAIAGWWNLAKFIVFNILAGLFVGLFTAVAVAALVGRPPIALTIVLTLVSVPPAVYFIWYWLRRRRTRAYGMPVLEVPAFVQSAWEVLDFIADLLSHIRIPLSRHVVFAAVGAALWGSLTLVGPIPAFIILLVILFMVFPLDDEE